MAAILCIRSRTGEGWIIEHQSQVSIERRKCHGTWCRSMSDSSEPLSEVLRQLGLYWLILKNRHQDGRGQR